MKPRHLVIILTVVALICILIVAIAHAQTAPQPVTLTVAEQQDLRNALGKLPYDEAAPLIQFFTIKQYQAQQAQAAADKAKQDAKKPAAKK